ncbi:MAG: adenylate kinase [Myxococcales bacterium]|nr:adenylate kinase [Myxococcales bacterium]
MNVILLGPPGAGKGTQAEAIVKRFGIPQVSTGDIIRATINDGSPLAAECRSYTDRGLLVPDGLVNRMVERRLAEPDCKTGFLLDGYPRTVGQAEALDEMLGRVGRKLQHVLLLEVDESVLAERITGRRTDPETGQIYHLTYNPPPPEVADRLIQRDDDTLVVLRERLAQYRAKTEALIPHYTRTGLLRHIDGSGKPELVRERIFAVLDADA